MLANTYANLTIDGHSILLAQTDILHIELASNIRPHTQESGSSGLGTVEYGHTVWPVYTLDAALSPLNTIPEQRRLVACINHTEQQLALACDTVTTLQVDTESIIEELPDIMRAQNSPIEELLYNNGNLHFISSAGALMSTVMPPEEQE